MEEIINSLSNPFDFESFKDLIKLYAKSKDRYEFHEKVSTYYEERDIDRYTHHPQVDDDRVEKEDLRSWKVLRFKSEEFPTEHRVYINPQIENVGKILDIFIPRCLEADVPFELKYMSQASERNDRLIIGSNTVAFQAHIDILRDIAKEHPEFVSTSGKPMLLSSPLDGWLGIADENIENEYKSYTESRLYCIDLAIKKFFLKHEEIDEDDLKALRKEVKSIEDEAHKDVENGYLESEEEESEISRQTNDLLRYVKINPALIEKYVSGNEESIKEIFDIFKEECIVKGIDPEYPIFQAGSRDKLLALDQKKKGISLAEIKHAIQEQGKEKDG